MLTLRKIGSQISADCYTQQRQDQTLKCFRNCSYRIYLRINRPVQKLNRKKIVKIRPKLRKYFCLFKKGT